MIPQVEAVAKRKGSSFNEAKVGLKQDTINVVILFFAAFTTGATSSR